MTLSADRPHADAVIRQDRSRAATRSGPPPGRHILAARTAVTPGGGAVGGSTRAEGAAHRPPTSRAEGCESPAARELAAGTGRRPHELGDRRCQPRLSRALLIRAGGCASSLEVLPGQIRKVRQGPLKTSRGWLPDRLGHDAKTRARANSQSGQLGRRDTAVLGDDQLDDGHLSTTHKRSRYPGRRGSGYPSATPRAASPSPTRPARPLPGGGHSPVAVLAGESLEADPAGCLDVTAAGARGSSRVAGLHGIDDRLELGDALAGPAGHRQ